MQPALLIMLFCLFSGAKSGNSIWQQLDNDNHVKLPTEIIYDSAGKLKQEACIKLDNIDAYLVTHPSVTIDISQHCEGYDERNYKRLKSVFTYLTRDQIMENQIRFWIRAKEREPSCDSVVFNVVSR